MNNINEDDNDLPFEMDNDENVSDYDFSEEESVDVSAFIIEEIQESRSQLAELIRNHKSEPENTIEVVGETLPENKQLKQTVNHPIAAVEPKKEANINDDFEYVRNNMIQLTKDGLTIIEDLMDFARSAQHPQLYRELTTSLKEVAVINKSILELHKIKNDLENNSKSDQPAVQNTQNNFFGTTEELLEMMQKQRNVKIVTPDGDNKNE